MTDRPIIFSAPMVRALLDGRKTQTRRVLKPQPERNKAGLWRYPPLSQRTPLRDWRGFCQAVKDGLRQFILSTSHCRYAPGERLWVREAWNLFAFSSDGEVAWPCDIPSAEEWHSDREMGLNRLVNPMYRATNEYHLEDMPWRSPIYMPRWASRITLTVTDVRVQRVQEISEADAIAEGVQPLLEPPDGGSAPHVAAYRDLWNSINAARGCGWDSNPWVAALTFTVAARNIDAEQG